MSRESFLARNKKGGSTVAHRRSAKQEREVAKRFVRGRQTPCSGAKSEKADVRVRGVVRIETKTTAASSFRVTLDMINTIEEAALPCNEVPALIIEFIDENGTPIREVAVLPTYVLGTDYA